MSHAVMGVFGSFLPALGWSLIHFLWEGALLGAMGWMALRTAQGLHPEVRHRLACMVLAAMGLAFLLTLVRMGMVVSVSGDVVDLEGVSAPVVSGVAGSRLVFLLGTNIRGLVALWLVGVACMGLRLTRGWLWLQFVCLREAVPVNGAWSMRLRTLCPDLSGFRHPRLMLSKRIDTLMVVGWIRPVILVPAAALAGLDTASLEAVLVHELSHVRRLDYLINLFQSAAEALFFFHPAVWWISNQIRLEREHCCDDAAIRSCGDPILYASALASLEALRTPTLNTMHLAPQARGGSLMLRIRRILNPQMNERVAPKVPGTLGFTLLPLLSSVALCMAMGVFAPRLRAEAPDSASKVVNVSFKQVKIAHQPAPPAYPPDAKIQRIQGIVKVEVVIGEDGTPIAPVKALSGPEALRAAATEYASQWRFEPVKVKGKAVKARFVLTMPFRLR